MKKTGWDCYSCANDRNTHIRVFSGVSVSIDPNDSFTPHPFFLVYSQAWISSLHLTTFGYQSDLMSLEATKHHTSWHEICLGRASIGVSHHYELGLVRLTLELLEDSVRVPSCKLDNFCYFPVKQVKLPWPCEQFFFGGIGGGGTVHEGQKVITLGNKGEAAQTSLVWIKYIQLTQSWCNQRTEDACDLSIFREQSFDVVFDKSLGENSCSVTAFTAAEKSFCRLSSKGTPWKLQLLCKLECFK